MIYIKGDDLDDRAGGKESTSFKQSLGFYVSAVSLSFPGISTLIAKGVYDSAFPLHDVSVRFGIPTRRPLVSIKFIVMFNLQRMETCLKKESQSMLCWISFFVDLVSYFCDPRASGYRGICPCSCVNENENER